MAISSARAQSIPASDELRLGPLGIMTQAPTLLDLGAGVYDLIGNAHRNETGGIDAELRLGQRWAGIGPAIGMVAAWSMPGSTAIRPWARSSSLP